MTDIFPPEIFDAILDHVHNLDGEARSTYRGPYISIRKITTKPVENLFSCSLVCRSWLPRTRLRIFNIIYITHYDRTIGLSFGALVAHPLCTFRSHIRRLSLHEGYKIRTEALWVHSVLPQLALLTNVEDLHIYGGRFWPASLPLFGSRLKRLDMQSIQLDQASRMTELVSRCTNLEHLFLRYISAPEGGNTVVRTVPPFRSLRSLALHDGIALTAEFLTWLCPSPSSIKIPTVELDGISAKDAHHVSRFLRDVGPSITSLALGFSDSSSSITDGQDAFCRVADFTTLTNLETLQLGPLTIYSIYLGRGWSAKHVPHILAKLDSPSLREIRFHVSMAQAADLEMIDWASVVPTLNSARYPSLEVLSFRPMKAEVLEETKAWLEEHVGWKLRRNVEIRCSDVLRDLVPIFVRDYLCQ